VTASLALHSVSIASRRRASAVSRSVRSQSAPSTVFGARGSASRFRARCCAASTRPLEEIRSTLSSSRVC
jgi:hypothetical protein